MDVEMTRQRILNTYIQFFLKLETMCKKGEIFKRSTNLEKNQMKLYKFKNVMKAKNNEQVK